MKILFSDNSLWGLLNFRGAVIRHFADRGNEVVIVAPKSGHAERHNNIPPGVRFMPVDMERTKTTPVGDLRYFLKLLKIYRAEKPDHIFHYTIKPNVYGSLAARICKTKSTAMLAGLGYAFANDTLASKIARGLYRLGLRCADSVMLLNEDNSREVIRRRICRADKIVLLRGGEGVDTEAFPFTDNQSDRTVFLFIGRLLYDKGYREFAECARRIKAEHPDVSFEISGAFDKSYPMCVKQDELTADCESGAIKYLGFTNDIREVFAREGLVVVLPSYHEGMNRSLMEACASGKPIITTDIGGCREMVLDGQNGYLVTPRSVDSLVSAVKRYLALSFDARRAMSLSSRRLAERRFDVKEVLEVYDRLV